VDEKEKLIEIYLFIELISSFLKNQSTLSVEKRKAQALLPALTIILTQNKNDSFYLGQISLSMPACTINKLLIQLWINFVKYTP
jgi:hypothetical protein